MAEDTTRTAYLERVGAGLRLPPDLEADVIEELRDHIADATDALVAAGTDRRTAEAEALDRLGRPEILAEQIRRAHQTDRRLLAAVAGGVVAAGGGAFRGFVFGMAAVSILAVTAMLAIRGLQTSGLIRADPAIAPGATSAAATVAVALALCLAAWCGSRELVAVVSRRSRRRAGDVRPWVAVVGGSAILALSLFGFRGTQTELSVVVVLLVPVAFVAGALSARGRAVEPTRRSTAMAFAILVGLGLAMALLAGTPVGTSLSAVGSGPFASMEDLLRSENMDLPGRYVADAPDFGDGTDTVEDGVVTVRLEAPASLSRWQDLRLEAWRSIDLPTLDRRFSSPFAATPLVRDGDRIEGSVRIDGTRDVENYWLVVTGLAADGQRDLLAQLTGSNTSFVGSAWDFLVAPH